MTLTRMLKLIADLHKTYIDDDHYNSGHGHAYKKYGIDPSVGAVVVVRPDQCKCFDQ
jgi:phenol 2-monooxygenase